jgi:hypothetical protein
LSQQCRDNLGVWKRLDELDHPPQVLLAEAAPEARLEPAPQRDYDLGAVLGPPVL